MEHISIGILQKEIEDLIKATLHLVLSKNIRTNISCHFSGQLECVKKAFNRQEIEILSRGNVQGRNLTRHLLYKLIKYTSSIGQPTEGWSNPPAENSVTCADDVVRLYQQQLITTLTLNDYETICRSIFPVVERLANGDLQNDISFLNTRLLYYLLTNCMDEEAHALLICLLLAKDGFISKDNVASLIVLLNDIRLTLSLCVINPEGVNLNHFSNSHSKHFVSYSNGKLAFASQSAMDSTFLVFLDLVENGNLQFDLLSVNDRFLRKYCRTAGYKRKPRELCFCLSSCQTNVFVMYLDFGIIDHPTIEDVETHRIVCEKYNIPLEVSRKGHEEIITFVKHLQNGKQPFFHARGMVVGCAGTGKTSLLQRINKKMTHVVPKETRAVNVYEHMFSIDNGRLYVRQLSDTMIDMGLPNGATRRSSEQTISVLDFAGQCGYYACHQIYFNRRSFFILVMDLTKPLDAIVNDTANEGTIFENWTHKEFFLFWMKSIHTYSNEHAPVILVWTHADKMENWEDEKSKSFGRITGMLRDENPELLQHIDVLKCFVVGFPRKRFLLKDVDPYRESLEEIKMCIMETSKQLEHWGMEIPTLWSIVERNIQKAKMSQKIVFVQDLWIQNDKMEETLRMKDRSELIKILTFFHEVGEILYFPETGLKDCVILDIQWFVDAFKYIITDISHASLDLEPEVRREKDYQRYIESGELSYRLLQKMWDCCKEKDFLRFHTELVTYMERLGLLTSITVFRKEIRASYRIRHRWYVPCMNRKTFDCEDFKTYTAMSSILCFEFQFLPNIVFYKLIASCMESEWKILQDRLLKCLYQRVVVFYRFDCFVFVGICRNSIEVQIRNLDQHASRKQRADIRMEMEIKLQQLSEKFHRNLHFQIGYKCSRTKFCDSSTTEVIQEGIEGHYILCTTCPVSRKHRISNSDLTWKCENGIHRNPTNNDHRDFELMLDLVASKVSRDIHMIAASLHLDQDEVDQISRNNQHSIQEKYFQILYHWRNKLRGNKEILYKALLENDRQDVIEAIDTFSRSHYKCPGVFGPEQLISSNDIRLVSAEIAHEYLRLARFLRLPQKKIEHMKMYHWDNINECILRTLELLRNITRQDLCDSLVYTSRMDITEKLIESWKKI